MKPFQLPDEPLLFISKPLAVTDSWIDHHVDQVHDQESNDGQYGEKNHVQKNDGIVAGHDRLRHQVADAGPREDHFDDDHRADQMRQR